MKPLLVVLIAIVVILAVLTFASVLPLAMATSYRCWDCGARAHRTSILLVPLPTHVTEGTLSTYWRKNVDPGHKHRWAPIYSDRVMPLRGWHIDYTAGSHPRWLLADACTIAILKSLPDTNARKSFVAQVSRDDPSMTRKDYGDLEWFTSTLMLAYEENPKRTDWVPVMWKAKRPAGVPKPSPTNGNVRLKPDS